jgi:predicted O-methyltransferase YrrM
MRSERNSVAAEILEASRRHDAAQADRLARFRSVEPETAALLGILIRAANATRILELGTSNVYSTRWLADAAEATGGAVTSDEIDPERTRMAAAHLDRAGLRADLRTDDAGTVLAASADGAWDFIFLDAERPEYTGYWTNLRRVLAPGATLAIDNALSHIDELGAFNRLLEADPHLQSALVPIGAGLILAVASD